ncbi:MAG: cell division protein FtsZ [Alphaproteobacteria bacterium]|nr:cell division protein FtsZ [Alphaproteobacteria bacterium]NCQ66672.1 cell division protein FtsZ [Alphaproteobacteria bacterium]NCT07123.1 cell division protein FtsZ [Alphaproteobacteria bacterium]
MTSSSLKKTENKSLGPKITVIGVGGAGNNAVNNMIRYELQGVEYLACNTDAQHLSSSLVEEERRIQLGLDVTQGLGAGSHPEVGRAAAEESLDEVVRFLKGSNMVFITAGMGGGTGTGAAPVIAQAAREMGILTIGVVTRPFNFEGPHRTRMAESGISEMEQYVDTLIVIPNQNLFRIATDKTTFADAFKLADDVLYSGVRGVTDLMIMPGLVNLDFADVRAVMTEMGKAMMGTGEAKGENRAIVAAEAAISNPLLDDISMRGAKGVLINITGGMDMTLFEVDAAANRIREEIDADVTIETNIIFGSTFDETLDGQMRVSVVATGIDSEAIKRRLAELAVEKQKQESAQERVETQLSMDEDLAMAGQGIPDSYTDADDFAETQPHSGSSYEFNAVKVGVNERQTELDPANDDARYGSIPLESSHTYDPHGSQKAPKKKGFLGRFMSTLTGNSEEPQETFRQGYASAKSDDVSTQEDCLTLDEFDNTDVQDIPAYLRRKSK